MTSMHEIMEMESTTEEKFYNIFNKSMELSSKDNQKEMFESLLKDYKKQILEEGKTENIYPN